MTDKYELEVLAASTDLPRVMKVAPTAATATRAEGTVATVRTNEAVFGRLDTDVLATPSNERLRQLAAAHPPPPLWLEGEEEDLF